MSDPNQPSTPPGWYPDGQGGQRWWDGNQWTEHTQPPAGGGAPEAPAAPASPAAPAAPSSPGVPGGDLPTQVAPNRASNYPAQPAQPAAPQQPQQPQQGVYGAPAGGGFGQSAGQPGGQPGFGQQQPYGGYPSGGSSSSGGGKGKLIAIIGGAIGALILVVIIVFVLLSLLGGGSPDDVAGDYLEANADGDFEKACELTSKDYRESTFDGESDCGKVEDAIAKSFEDSGIPGYDDYEDFLDDIEYDFEIGDVTEKEKTATVEYTYSIEYTGDEDDFGDFFNQKDQDAEIGLVKEDGDWKVDSDSGDF